MKKKIIITLAVLAVLGVLTATGLLVADYLITRERFPKNTFIEGINVSLLTPYEAAAKLRTTDVDTACPTPVVLFYNNKEFAFSPSEIGLGINAEATIRRAFADIHGKSYFLDLAQRLKVKFRSMQLSLYVDDRVLAPVVYDLQSKVNQPPKDAHVNFSATGEGTLISEEVGVKMLPQETMRLIKSKIKQGERRIQIQAVVTPPRITYANLSASPPIYLLAKYTTYYGTHDSPNRIHNIKTIAKKLNGSLLLSGETFSLLNKIGSFDAESGLKEAFVIIGDELIPEFGGGTCQIATTLYNSVALADLKIKQRRNHSIWFNIYPLGRDATVYPPYTDLKFINSTNAPVLIHAIAKKRSLTFKVFGTPSSKEVSFSGLTITAWNSEEAKWVKTRRVPHDSRPFRTTVARIVKQNNKVVEEEEIKSYYKMVGDRDYVKIKRPEPR